MALAACVALTLGGCGGNETSSSTSAAATGATVANSSATEGKPEVKVPTGPPPTELVIDDLKKGTGAVARRGHEAIVRYVGVRWNGEPFQSSWDSGKSEPFNFELGLPRAVHEVMPGWEKGIPGMRVGGRRELVIPPQLIYYPGHHPKRPLRPDDTLVYVVELIGVN